MGWSKGKGLGAKMDGDQNFVRISHKADQKGIGYADRDDQWTTHENNFNSLLKSLDDGAEHSASEHCDTDTAAEGAFCGLGFGSSNKSKKKKNKKDKTIKSKLSGKSLEEMSKSSGVRVHYRKFTRGKDISRYSEKDLANIFGKKVDDDDEPQAAAAAEDTTNTKENDDVELRYGITTIETGTTISDYFKRKKNKKAKKGEDDVEPAESNGCSSEAVAETAEIIDVETLPDDQIRKKKKKSKRTRSEAAIDEDEIITIAESPTAVEVDKEKDKKKKKKKKKNKEKERESVDEIVNLDETVITLLDEDSMEVNDVVVEKPPKAKKRKKNAPSPEPTNDDTEVTSTDHHQPTANSAFFKHILDTILTVNSTSSGTSSTELNQSATAIDQQTRSANANIGIVQPTPIFAETYELNRYQAEMFRFVDLSGFPNANISNLSGYGFSKNIDLKITAKSQDHSRINDLWDYALINKYGKDVIRTKKKQRYSVKALKKKSLFKAL